MTPKISHITDSTTSWLSLLVEFGFQNKPLILAEWSTSTWAARKNWVSEDGAPNIAFFEENYGFIIRKKPKPSRFQENP